MKGLGVAMKQEQIMRNTGKRRRPPARRAGTAARGGVAMMLAERARESRLPQAREAGAACVVYGR